MSIVYLKINNQFPSYPFIRDVYLGVSTTARYAFEHNVLTHRQKFTYLQQAHVNLALVNFGNRHSLEGAATQIIKYCIIRYQMRFYYARGINPLEWFDSGDASDTESEGD